MRLTFLIGFLGIFLSIKAQEQITIDGLQAKHTISPMVQGFGLIYCFEADSIYEDGTMAQTFKDAGAGFLRYPGGAVTTMYHWNDLNGHGWLDSWNPDYDAESLEPINFMDVDEYFELCQTTGAEPMLGINMSSGRNYNRQEEGLNEAVALLKYCNEKNYDVKYLYLDNENHHKKWPADEYARQINYYADSLKKYAPNAKYIANWTDKVQTNVGGFTTLVNMAGHNFDYIDIHWYWKWTEGSWAEWIVKTPMENETEWYDGGTFVEEISFFNNLMKQLGKPNIKLTSMEWNLGPGKYKNDPEHTPFKTALMQAEMQMQMMQGGLEIASLWSTQWPNDATSDFQFLVSSSNKYEQTPTAEFYKLYKHALNGTLHTSSCTDKNVLTATSFQNSTKAFVYLLNKNSSSIDLSIEINGFDIEAVEKVLCFQDPGIIQDIDVQSNEGYSITVPEYSLTMVELTVEKSSDFYVSAYSPTEATQISTSNALIFAFNQKVTSATAAAIDVFINKEIANEACEWSLGSPSTLSLTPKQNWPKGSLISIFLRPDIKSADGLSFNGSRLEYEFIVDTDENFGLERIEIPTLVTRNNGIHNIPLKIALPKNRTHKVPVQFWVHGGGWNGGTETNSYTWAGPHSDYLAEKLGIATLEVAYRCNGSNGTFTKAMDDIDAVYQWAVENAEKYNFDLSNSFFSGGSAGTPLSALAAQRYPSIKAYVGFNGVYNFVENPGSTFPPNGSYYQHHIPSTTENSAIYNLRDSPPITLLLHGDQDATINYKQSTLYADAIIEAGGIAETVIYKGEEHAFFNQGKVQYEDCLYELAKFLKTHGIIQTEKTGSVERSEINDIKIWPNPASDSVTINAEKLTGKIRLELYNIKGESVLSRTINTTENTHFVLSLKNLNNGSYIVVLSDESGKEYKNKLLIKNE